MRRFWLPFGASHGRPGPPSPGQELSGDAATAALRLCCACVALASCSNGSPGGSQPPERLLEAPFLPLWEPCGATGSTLLTTLGTLWGPFQDLASISLRSRWGSRGVCEAPGRPHEHVTRRKFLDAILKLVWVAAESRKSGFCVGGVTKIRRA